MARLTNAYTMCQIPPRTMFSAQFFAVTWLSMVQIATYNFLRGNIKGICTTEQAEGLTCPGARTFYNASVIWGVVGPKKMFCELISLTSSALVVFQNHRRFRCSVYATNRRSWSIYLVHP